MTDHDFCVFCAIVDGELPASFVYRDDTVVSIMDINPMTPGHLLVLPVEHLPTLADVDGDVAARLMSLAHRIAAAHRTQDPTIEGVNLHLSDGPVAGQEVAHTHLHVIPRRVGDGFGLRVVRGETPTAGELAETSARIAGELDSP